jgi:hypothetical protein
MSVVIYKRNCQSWPKNSLQRKEGIPDAGSNLRVSSYWALGERPFWFFRITTCELYRAFRITSKSSSVRFSRLTFSICTPKSTAEFEGTGMGLISKVLTAIVYTRYNENQLGISGLLQ